MGENENKPIEVNAQGLVEYIQMRLIGSGETISTETINKIFDLETDYLIEIGVIRLEDDVFDSGLDL